MILGLDVAHYPVPRPLIWLAQIPLLSLLIRRVASPMRSDGNRSAASRRVLACVRYLVVNASAAAMVAIGFLFVTGKAGFIKTV